MKEKSLNRLTGGSKSRKRRIERVIETIRRVEKLGAERTAYNLLSPFSGSGQQIRRAAEMQVRMKSF